MRRVFQTLTILALGGLAACEDNPITEPKRELPPPGYAIVDALHGNGNPFFFFRAPLVSEPPTIPGTFDNTLLDQLRIDIFRLNSSGAPQGSAIKTLASSSSFPERLYLNPNDESYAALWNTVGVNSNINYQIQVRAGSQLLGSIDVDFVRTLREFANVDRNNFVGWYPGLPLLIRFAVQQGALGVNQPPLANILTPANGTPFVQGATVVFSGTGVDPEDGQLPDDQLSWSSDIDGTLGTGSTIARNDLTAGTQTITLTVTDNQGLSASTSVTFPVVANQPITLSSGAVGSGLQRTMTGSLGAPAPAGGVTVQITSVNPNNLLISNSPTVAGAASADIFVPQDQITFSYIAQGMETATVVSISATAPGYSDGTVTLQVVVPLIRINNLPATIELGSGDIPFHVQVGVANEAGTDLLEAQAVRAGANAAAVTVASSDPNVARIVTAAGAGATGQALIPPGQSTSSITPTGLSLRTDAYGFTRISASAADWNSLDDYVVEVPDRSITLSGPRVGAGLMSDIVTATLGSPAPAGGVNVRVLVIDPTFALVARDHQSGGSTQVDVFVPAGQVTASFVVHGISNGQAALSASAMGYASGSATVTVVDITARIDGLPNTAAPNQQIPFTVHTGIPTLNGTDFDQVQRVRIGGAPVQFTLVSSLGTVGRLVTQSTNGTTAIVQIQPGEFSSPLQAINGGVEFLAGDASVLRLSTTITVLSPVRVPQGQVTVTIQ